MPKSIMAKSMTFPLLKVNEIVSCSDELRVLIQTADLKTPQVCIRALPCAKPLLRVWSVDGGSARLPFSLYVLDGLKALSFIHVGHYITVAPSNERRVLREVGQTCPPAASA